MLMLPYSYSMYQAVIAVVAHYYRPASDDAELQARLSLTWILSDLSFLLVPKTT